MLKAEPVTPRERVAAAAADKPQPFEDEAAGVGGSGVKRVRQLYCGCVQLRSDGSL